MTPELALAANPQERLKSLLRKDHDTYVAAIHAIQKIATPTEFWNAVKQLGGKAIKQGIITVAPNTTLESLLSTMSMLMPGELLWAFNKSITDPFQRHAIAKAVSVNLRQRPTLPAEDVPLAQSLKETGFLLLPDILSTDEIAELAAFLRSRPNVIQDGPTYANTVEDIVCAPHALRLATHPKILGLVAEFLGAAPLVADLCAWRTEPSIKDDYGAHIFHRDRDDFRACKMFVYLSDVDTHDGPHIFARQTHDPEFTQRFLANNGLDLSLTQSLFTGNGRHLADKIPQLFGEQIIEITGKAGTSFLEATYGFHRGKTVKGKPRLLYQVMYANVMYPVRHKRFAPVSLQSIPDDCIDNDLTRQALRPLLAC